ncbi:peptidoglycan DD-metalloendopeptidase family protein [Saccharopolyspora sp. WRP15-2]|uniref:Peptidoglycan DD-metalloendopeptidase family protein n=1 Tax=Saccharopolyspora oryzae TaxID=2997343 RepID=A0ABT4V770_9PSEU|nr:M23 family metallopeptidase [Saccharopolyspora oryzae]MDA3629809.1 peptidoglycan DD-metalloendopeptidase family protein [Saccharopolyspora oryzae]
MRQLITSALLCTGIATAAIGLSTAPEPVARPAPAASSRTAEGQFGWPLAPPPAVARPFESPEHAYGPGHRGVDLVGEVDQQVLAAGDGVVVFAGQVAGRNLVSIEHPPGLRTTYEPVRPTAAVGDQVTRGQPIGYLEPGHPECTAQPPNACLHWGARQHLTYLDPLRLLGGGHVRLLPWD